MRIAYPKRARDRSRQIWRAEPLTYESLSVILPSPMRITSMRHRLDFGGNRRINAVLYVASITQQRFHPDARAYFERKVAEGKTRRGARRAHKRHLANRVIRRMWKDEARRLNNIPTDAA